MIIMNIDEIIQENKRILFVVAAYIILIGVPYIIGQLNLVGKV